MRIAKNIRMAIPSINIIHVSWSKVVYQGIEVGKVIDEVTDEVADEVANGVTAKVADEVPGAARRHEDEGRRHRGHR